MKYKNVVILCKQADTESLQKYLFRLKYSWIDSGKKNRHIKEFSTDMCIVISNDTTMHYRLFIPTMSYKDHKFIKYPQFIRKEKLLKLKNV